MTLLNKHIIILIISYRSLGISLLQKNCVSIWVSTDQLGKWVKTPGRKSKFQCWPVDSKRSIQRWPGQLLLPSVQISCIQGSKVCTVVYCMVVAVVVQDSCNFSSFWNGSTVNHSVFSWFTTATRDIWSPADCWINQTWEHCCAASWLETRWRNDKWKGFPWEENLYNTWLFGEFVLGSICSCLIAVSRQGIWIWIHAILPSECNHWFQPKCRVELQGAKRSWKTQLQTDGFRARVIPNGASSFLFHVYIYIYIMYIYILYFETFLPSKPSGCLALPFGFTYCTTLHLAFGWLSNLTYGCCLSSRSTSITLRWLRRENRCEINGCWHGWNCGVVPINPLSWGLVSTDFF